MPLEAERVMAKNKKWSAKTKLEIVLLASKGDMTISELCKRHQVAPAQVNAWRKQLLAQGAEVFERPNKSKKKNESSNNEVLQKELYEKIGQLTVERDFLKKALDKFHGNLDGS